MYKVLGNISSTFCLKDIYYKKYNIINKGADIMEDKSLQDNVSRAIVAKLRELYNLKKNGVITNEEFIKRKHKLLYDNSNTP